MKYIPCRRMLRTGKPIPPIQYNFRKAQKVKATGIIRNIDELGRIVIPKEMRKKMDIRESDPVEIHAEEDRIVLTKYYPACFFCGSTAETVIFKGKQICKDCMRELKTFGE